MSSAKVPAWKKLGLKLKQPGAASTTTTTTPASSSSPAHARGGPVGHHSQGATGQTPKRKFDAPPAAADGSLAAQGAKRPRRDDDRNASARKHKSVSFGDTPTKADLQNSTSSSTTTPSKSNLRNNTTTTTTTKPKKAKGPAKKEKPQPPVDLTTSLEYLRQWKTSRDKWKFNKNHQSQLIKHVFDADGIPASDITTFYEYIRDLKGFVRQRLREDAMEVKVRDATLGAKGFPEGTKDVAAKQSTYEAMLQDFFGPPPGSNKRKLFDEAEYLANTPDADFIIRRVIKRFRAELILDELSDDGETDVSTTTTSTGQSTTESYTGSENTVTQDKGEAAKKINAPTGKRRRKLRTNMDDSSSSESESDSDSDSSSDGSSSDESDDEEEETTPAAAGNGYGSDSSSSSSSSDDDSDDDESDSDEEEEEEKKEKAKR